MTPSKGRIVFAIVTPEMNNGDDFAPAIITRVWDRQEDGSHIVNLRVLCDSENLLWLTSVRLYDTEDAARTHGQHAAFWPPRV